MHKKITITATLIALSLAGCGSDEKPDVLEVDAPSAAQASTAISAYLAPQKGTLVQEVPLEESMIEGNQAEYNACTSFDGAKVAKAFVVEKESGNIRVKQAAPAPAESAVAKACV